MYSLLCFCALAPNEGICQLSQTFPVRVRGFHHDQLYSYTLTAQCDLPPDAANLLIPAHVRRSSLSSTEIHHFHQATILARDGNSPRPPHGKPKGITPRIVTQEGLFDVHWGMSHATIPTGEVCSESKSHPAPTDYGKKKY